MKNGRIHSLRALALVVILSTSSLLFGQFYNGSVMDFGKNRIQYPKDLLWTYFRQDHYDVYFYEGGKELATYVAQSAQKNIELMQKVLDFELNSRIQFIVYNKQSEFLQSNIGLSMEQQNNTGGSTRIVGTKVELFFDGNHEHLENQIKSGIAQIILNEMFYGGSTREMVKNSALLNLPEWFTKGLEDYLACKWSTDLDNALKDKLTTKALNRLNQLQGENLRLAGHAIWFYITETYGEGVITNLLYIAKTNRNIESALLYVIGIKLENLTKDYLDFYHIRYGESEKQRISPIAYKNAKVLLKKPRASRVYSQAKISPDGKNLIYVTNELGQKKVWLQDLSANRRPKRLFKLGTKIERINDYSYPLLAWHPSGKLFAMITEEKGSIWLTTYELDSKAKTKRTIIHFDKILDFAYSDDGSKFAMSAVQKGQSDIFVFTAASNGYEQVTKDVYDDLHPRFVHHSKEIIFSSNRPMDSLQPVVKKTPAGQNNLDIFVYDYNAKSPVLKRITNTPTINEDFGNAPDSINYSFTSDQNGINNIYQAHPDSVLSAVDTAAHYRFVVNGMVLTDFSTGVVEQDYESQTHQYVSLFREKGVYKMLSLNQDDLSTALANPIEPSNTVYRENIYKIEKKNGQKSTFPLTMIGPKPAPPSAALKANTLTLHSDSDWVDINHFSFLTLSPTNAQDKAPAEIAAPNFAATKDVNKGTAAQAKVDSSKLTFKPGQQKNYYINFSNDHVVTQLDNSFLNSSYQPFTGQPYNSPPTSALLKIGSSDLFEDYRIVAGMRIPFDLSTFEYFLSFESRGKRIDKQLVLHRIALSDTNSQGYNTKPVTDEAIYSLKYPLSEVAAVKLTGTLRNDRFVVQSVDLSSLKTPDVFDTWGIAKLEYIYDNTIMRGVNILNGCRFKLFAEHYHRIDQSSSAIPSPLTGLFGEANTAAPNNGNQNNFSVVGFDFRFYQKIHRNMIWASRVAASSSFGPEQLLYYMGGVDNSFAPQFNTTTSLSPNANYAFQTLATPLRGFTENIRNGNNFFVINNEIRWPIFSYFIKRPIQSEFIKTFQLIGFTDVGMAWFGANPYTNNNATTTTYLPGNPITVTLTQQNEPLVGGFGMGVRGKILGYFVRVDYAKGIENRVVLPDGVWYISLGLDF